MKKKEGWALRGLALILCLALLLVGCAATPAGNDEDAVRKPKIVCTIFPQYDWMRQLLGDAAQYVDLTLLVKDGVDLHSYQPTADDILKIADCDLLVYVGGESDKWVEDALKSAPNPKRVTISLLELLGDKAAEEELTEGMQPEQGAEETPALDEHVWLSVKNAELFCTALEQALYQVHEANAAVYHTYQQNCIAYLQKLQELDEQYAAAVAGGARKTVLFGDRFPFRYLVEDYGLTYYAAFPGCSAETEASFATVAFLAGKVDELGLPAVLVIDGSSETIAKTIVENTQTKDQQILVLDSMQAVTQADIEGGTTYLEIMQKNLDVLEQALA